MPIVFTSETLETPNFTHCVMYVCKAEVFTIGKYIFQYLGAFSLASWKIVIPISWKLLFKSSLLGHSNFM